MRPAIGWVAIGMLGSDRAWALQEGRTLLASCTPEGSLASSGSDSPHVSADGRFVIFTSAAPSFVEGDDNEALDVFVRDTWKAQTERASVSSSGAQANGPSFAECISPDGRYVGFSSLASNLVGGDTYGVQDVFMRDRALGTTQRVSVATSGNQGNGMSLGCSLSGDGRLVAFESEASDLVSGDGNSKRDVFVRDRSTGQTRRISVDSAGGEADGTSQAPHLARDGASATFSSYATDLVHGDTNSRSDVFVRDLVKSKTRRVSVDSDAREGDGSSWLPSISADGSVVAFQSLATNLVADDGNDRDDIFVHDLATGETSRVSVDSAGKESGGPPATTTCRPRLSANGRWVAFYTYQDHLVPGDTNRDCDVFLHDRLRHETIRASLGTAENQANKDSANAALSDDGRFVVFQSRAFNLLGEEGPDIGREEPADDIFLRERYGLPGQPYCFGDGSGTDCPCANAGWNDEGCANTSGHGAFLTAIGSSGVVADDLAFVAARLPPDLTATLFVADSAHSGGVPFEDGLLCIEGNRKLLGLRQVGPDGIASWGPGLLAAGGWSAGQTRRFQVWYEDPGGPCGTGHNQSNAYEVTFLP